MSLGKTIIRLLTALIPIRGLRRSLRRRLLEGHARKWLEKTLPVVRSRYVRHEEECRARLARGEKIRVAFVVCDVSMFSFEPVYMRMREDPAYDCFIAVVPRVTRGERFLRDTLKKTVDTLVARYGGAVRCLYDPDTREERPLEGTADVVFTSIVYDDQTCARYTALPISAYALVVGTPYGYGGIFNSSVYRMATLNQPALFWRLFVSNDVIAELFASARPLLRETMRSCGYPKMDRMAGISRRRDRVKTVLICPHHTLARGKDEILAISTFLKFADFFLRLPTIFPDMRFVFRPHPLLFPRLETDEWWGRQKADDYRAALEAQPNVEFQQGGDYFETFVNSDAMVHDCGSFMAEYFYAGHPQCYLLEAPGALDAQLTPFGKRLQEHVAHACTEDEIVDFVRRVAEGRVTMADDPAWRDFAAQEVCVAHPHAASEVVSEIDRALKEVQR